MAGERFSIVVPTVGRHDKYLPKLIFDLRKEKLLIGELIVVRSGLNSHFSSLYKLFFYILCLILNPGFHVEVLTLTEKQTAGQNRNTGWAIARFEFTAFLDADDIYHRYRLTTINELLHIRPNANLVLHLYSFSKLEDSYFRLNANEMVSTDSIHSSISAEIGNLSRNWENPGIYNLAAVGKNGEALNIPQGHATVRSCLRDTLKYSNLPKGEDGLFCSKVLVTKGEVFVILRELSFYRNFKSSFSPNIFKKYLIRIRDTLFSIFQK